MSGAPVLRSYARSIPVPTTAIQRPLPLALTRLAAPAETITPRTVSTEVPYVLEPPAMTALLKRHAITSIANEQPPRGSPLVMTLSPVAR